MLNPEFIERAAHSGVGERFSHASSLQALESIHCATEASIGRSVRAEGSVESVSR
jgi:hypothetical protein